ncbi:Nif3-like dinuclear metal center hexameric protein [Tissierella sp. MSJ-40]|uniref:Nif3-like dinuclear metal center hexameric protein n=1 Tax=Tissierella simiarum TaxID=2841534 RepID=A0ABS6E7I1_9FIRM|nr:Nif3-like dinuclear metal center hexameric protein [Tissierella simiarum]MBU5438709.1 Nif3-like dinuclear metal center hexameric protein [Tissierella simiarum]
MLAKELYLKLYDDFQIEGMKDDWSFVDFNDYIFTEFKDKHIGVMLDNSEYIKKVYTAVFPDKNIIEKILKTGKSDILLFSHHAMGYDGRVDGFPFYNIPKDYLKQMKEKRISFYVLHLPLDKNGEYSTSINLAEALNLEIVDEFCEVEGVKVGIICRVKFKYVDEFCKHIEGILGHKVKFRNYGDEIIKGGKVAIAAGGGSYPFVATELSSKGINLYLTGFTRPLQSFQPTIEFHKIAQENRINIVGATHYSTEKYACIAMVDYFKELGLSAEFIEGEYYLEDL